MLHSLQETKYDFLLLLLQPTQMKLNNNKKQHSSGVKLPPRRDILLSVTNGR